INKSANEAISLAHFVILSIKLAKVMFPANSVMSVLAAMDNSYIGFRYAGGPPRGNRPPIILINLRLPVRSRAAADGQVRPPLHQVRISRQSHPRAAGQHLA